MPSSKKPRTYKGRPTRTVEEKRAQTAARMRKLRSLRKRAPKKCDPAAADSSSEDDQPKNSSLTQAQPNWEDPSVSGEPQVSVLAMASLMRKRQVEEDEKEFNSLPQKREKAGTLAVTVASVCPSNEMVDRVEMIDNLDQNSSFTQSELSSSSGDEGCEIPMKDGHAGKRVPEEENPSVPFQQKLQAFFGALRGVPTSATRVQR